ncbi:F-box/kelch-repeat protein At3g06240-like [Cornus florida]|uniref:F-box/kelch-repeat protein At3g06240-like n=1 Tax=Cornus florida TaxID=4283 RepID=UPI00289F7546|nr:F-box/kelch-repeat protein At3g06240-like [Cornus florida]XP_059650316.1 F-box/kelch-repeat protein At3g06240-like [Cornus florida]XP_059650324.1 F-box/kelch-repeat protein At3g06240-like [Cornus florida]
MVEMSICAVVLDELMIDILSRLPAKSLCRFKCVAKSWFALISSPHFAKTHLNRSNNNKCERLILFSGCSLYSVDCTEASYNDCVTATEIDFPKIEDPHYFKEILASCNGLLLVCEEEDTKFLLNPSTRESKKVPDYDFGVDPSTWSCMYGLGYDSSMDDYKVVAVFYYEDEESYCIDTFVVVHSLKTSSWTRIQDFPYDISLAMPSSGVFVNGSIHWLTHRSSDHSLVIAAFDVAEETFRDVLPPSSLEEDEITSGGGLGLLGGCLMCHVWGGAKQADIWVMKEYGVTESWTKYTIYIPNNMYPFFPMCVSDKEVLLKMEGDKEMGEDVFVIYNAKERRLRCITVDGIPPGSVVSPYYQSAVTYVESIVSPYFHCGIDRKELSTMTDASLAHNRLLMPPLDQLILTDEEKKVLIL